jgi:hypothetical protein
LVSAASASAKWLTVVSFLASQKLPGKNDDAIIFSYGFKQLTTTKKVQADRLDTNSRKATGHV